MLSELSDGSVTLLGGESKGGHVSTIWLDKFSAEETDGGKYGESVDMLEGNEEGVDECPLDDISSLS